MSEQLGLTSKADRIYGGRLHRITNANRQSVFASTTANRPKRPPQIKFNDLASAVNTGVIEDNPLNFDVRVDFFRQSDERVITAITIQTENKDLVFQDSGGLQQARMNIFGRITSVAGRRAGIFEDPVITSATTEELTEAKDASRLTKKQ